MRGPRILVETLSDTRIRDKLGNDWQYHSRSDHHSKVACWGVIFDLMQNAPLLRRHVESGVVSFGINHEMRDFVHDRKKNLDLVLCTSSGVATNVTLETLAAQYGIVLRNDDRDLLRQLPTLRRAPVGSVIMALEAKACMTAHQRALPRLYDELNSSQATVHGAADQAIAVGFAMVNVADQYLSPDLNKRQGDGQLVHSFHKQPRAAQIAVDKIRQLPRRSRTGENGYDALAISVIDMRNDGSQVRLVEEAPAPLPGDIYHYSTMISRLAGLYATRFKDLG